MSSDAPTMRAIYQDEHGGAESFKLGDLPKPSPEDGEILVQIHAASVNPIDLKRSSVVKGGTLPIVGGYDMAGVIASVGSGDVGDFKIGDRVFAEVTGDVFSLHKSGTFAEFCVVKADKLAIIPDQVSFVDIAATPMVVGTAMQMFDELGLKKGHRLFISGGAGGVGVHAMQIAKNVYGAAEVATTASAGKFDFVKSCGADRVVDYKSDDAGEVLKGWADVAIDCTTEVPMCKKIVKDGGKICSIVDMNSDDATFVLVEATGELMADIAKFVEEKKFNIVIDKVYSLDDGIEAIEHVAGGRTKGKVVIKVI